MKVGTTTMAATSQGLPAAADLEGESAATVICWPRATRRANRWLGFGA